jgi:hypothetical protein
MNEVNAGRQPRALNENLVIDSVLALRKMAQLTRAEPCLLAALLSIAIVTRHCQLG